MPLRQMLLLFALLGTWVSASVGFSPINGGCATLETPAQCNQASSCAWRWNSNSCETSCRSEYAFDMSGCCNDDACEWYSAPHAWECRERCGSLATSDQCVVEPSCAWDTKNQVCSSSCSRYGNSSYNCSTDPSCMWSGSMCLTNPNPPQTLMMIGFTASSYDMARMVNMTVGWRATLTLAVQADLMAAYHSRVVMNPTWTADWGALVGSYWAPTTQVPSAVSTNNQTVAAITWTQTLKVCNAALLPGTMGPVNVAFVQPVNPPDVGTGLSAGQIALVVLGTVLFVGVIGAMVAVWMYRRNPYAAAVGPPVTAVASFPEEEYDRLKTMNERTLSYEELRSIHQRWEAIHGAAGANESFNRWPIIAQCDMPKKYHRSPEIRTAWFELCTKLFPTAFEQFTHIRIGFDEAGFVRCAPAKAQQVLQYNTALRVVLQPNRNSVDLVLLGTARFLVVDPSRDDVGVPPMDNAFLLEPDAPDTCNAVKDLFDQSMLCSHTGTIGNRKIVMGRLVRRTSFVVPASDDLMANDAMVLIGAPASWDADMVEAAIMLMIRIGCQRLVVGALPCWSNMHVHARRGGGETGGWHIHVHPPQALSVLIAVSCRFWGLDDDILCCQCTSGIPITSTSNVALSASSTTTAREEFEMHLIAAPRE